MYKTLKEKLSDCINDLTEEIIKLENTSGTEARIRRNTLNDVIDYLEVLLDAEQRREFTDFNTK